MASALGAIAHCRANVSGFTPKFDLKEAISRTKALTDEYEQAPEQFKNISSQAGVAFTISQAEGVRFVVTPIEGLQVQVERRVVNTIDHCVDTEKVIIDETVPTGLIPGRLPPHPLPGRAASLNSERQ